MHDWMTKYETAREMFFYVQLDIVLFSLVESFLFCVGARLFTSDRKWLGVKKVAGLALILYTVLFLIRKIVRGVVGI